MLYACCHYVFSLRLACDTNDNEYTLTAPIRQRRNQYEHISPSKIHQNSGTLLLMIIEFFLSLPLSFFAPFRAMRFLRRFCCFDTALIIFADAALLIFSFLIISPDLFC